MRKVLGIFYLILAVAWVVVGRKEPERKILPKITRRSFPRETPYNFPPDYAETHKTLAKVFGDTTTMFTEENIPVLILPPFTMTTDDDNPVLLDYITKSAFSYLYNDNKIRVVQRDYTSENRSRIKARYILIGKISPIGNQFRITIRIQDINTGEILDAYDEYISKTQVSKYL